MAQVICFGLLVADCVTATVDTLPERGTLAIVDRVELHVGGCAANTAIALAKLGLSAGIIGGVGADGLGDFVLGAVAGAGVDVRGVKRFANVPTAATTVCVHSDAERTFLHVPGANARFVASDADWSVIDGAGVFHIAGAQLMGALERENGIAAVAEEAKRRGMTVTLDTVMNPESLGWQALAPALPFVDWMLPSEPEAATLTGETDLSRQAEAFRTAGAKNVAIKRGAAGCAVFPDSGAPFTVPPLSVAALDTLGAGDAWVAGFLLGLVRGLPAPETARFANAVGAFAVTGYGATTMIRTEAETLAFLNRMI
ncbi:MAG: sugar kinase [Armatimonadetes bacterium]|nr:sugar kinase [Armatimonadota bacterium]